MTINYIASSVLTQNRTLKTERKRRGWSQAQLANAMGVTTRTVIRWEHGLALPQSIHRVHLETLFGQTIEGNLEINDRKLKTERKQRGWTQAWLANAMGVTTRTVIRWEHGLALPRNYHRVRLETLFGKTSEELGLFWNTDEKEADDLLLAVTSPIAYQAMAEGTGQRPLLVDTTIPQTLDTNDSLLGRAGLFMQIKERLLNAHHLPLTALYGLPGIGKTTLAAALATDPQVQARFRDGILWAPLGPQPHVLNHLRHWGTLFGIMPNEVEDPESPLAWGRILRWAIGTRQMLLILGDAWTTEDALFLQVGGSRCTHLLTTRQPQVAFTFAQQNAIMVPQLEEADGLALLARWIPQVIQQDPQAAQSLVQTLDCSPLALTLMGKSLASLALTNHNWSLRAALMQLHNSQDHFRLSMSTAFEKRPFSLTQMTPFGLYAAIATCVQQLSP